MKATTLFCIVIALACCHREGAVGQTSRGDVEFYLFTRQNPNVAQRLRYDDQEWLENTNFNKEWPVRFLIHGWRGSKDIDFNTLIRKAYLKKGNFNVIVVDWSPFALAPYTEAVLMVEPVGRAVGKFSEFLNRAGVDFDNMYLIGHSLGAHVAGVAGSSVAPRKFNTIFALDPARPGFENVRLSRRVAARDAKYVESMHTNTGKFGLGLTDPVGHASFYPNYASHIQPGCDYVGCSHKRAFIYFAESINSNVGFYGRKYGTGAANARMGGEPSEKKLGVYYLQTNAAHPFARG